MLKAQILEQLNDLCDTRALDLTMGYKKPIPVYSRPFTLCISKGSGEAAVVAFSMTRQEFHTDLRRVCYCELQGCCGGLLVMTPAIIG